MIINHTYRFIFLKTRKTAGTSIEVALSRFCGPHDVISPIRGRDERIREALGYRGPQNHHLPFRLYSRGELLYALRRRKRKRPAHAGAAMVRRFVGSKVWDGYFKFCFERNPFDKAISRYYYRTQPPRPAIGDYLETVPDHMISDWEIYTIDDEVAVDFIGRYENLSADLHEVTQRLGLPGSIDLPRAKAETRSNRDHYTRVLDARARTRVENVCAREIALHGYQWETAPQEA